MSPLGSDAEDVGSRDSEVASSTSTTVTSAGGEPKGSGSSSAKESKKKTSTVLAKKKGPTFVASAASRRRPAMPRRQSSQSASGGADTVSKDKIRGDSPGQTPDAEPKLSAKSAGKRPVVQAKAEESASKHDNAPSPDTPDRPTTIQAKQPTTQRPKLTTDIKKDEYVVAEGDQAKETEPRTTQRKSDVKERVKAEDVSSTVPPRNAPFSPRRGSGEVGRGRRAIALTSPSTAVTSNATAQGTIIEFDENLPTKQIREEDARVQSGYGRTGTSSGTLLDPRFTPTPPSTAPAVPLGRSKSQLALLLRQDEKKPRR